MLSNTAKTYLQTSTRRITASGRSLSQATALSSSCNSLAVSSNIYFPGLSSVRATAASQLVALTLLSPYSSSSRLNMSSASSAADLISALPARAESDSFGELPIPAGKLWGAQTQRSIGNFPIGGPESKSKYFLFHLFHFK